MEKKNKEIMTIKELDKFTFMVEPYQRGYKWGEREINYLLDDINEFVPKDENSFYCLQPIIVKIIKEKNNGWELIDGQQRLTTIYLILSYLDCPGFSMDYNTRDKSREYLRNLGNYDLDLLDGKNNAWEGFVDKYPNYNNVDIYHFFQAKIIIQQWFEKNMGIGNGTKHDFKEKLLNHTGVIWYEPVPAPNGKDIDAYQTFRSINAGKIRLTNAELIKSVLLINDKKNGNDTQLLFDQSDLARQWDFIEQSLQNSVLWGFLNPDKTYVNRIEYLFSLCLENMQNKKSNDPYELFYVFQNKNPTNVWNDVQTTFMIFQEWHNDDDLYHWIGFLRATKSFKMKECLKTWKEEAKTKQNFKNNIKKEVLKALTEDGLENLCYGEHNKEIECILLFFNIMTLGSIENGPWNSRFRFDLYLNEKWSLEHIHAQNEVPKDKLELVQWLQSTYDFYKNKGGDYNENKELRNDLKKLESYAKTDNFKSISSTDLKALADKLRTEPMHKIGNMALLSGDINSSLSNGYFHIKREKLIEFDKKGAFILPATKNVFLKYYSDSNNKFNIHDWNNIDMETYTKAIQETLDSFKKEIES